MKSTLQRFEEKYEKIAGVDCWIWTGARHKYGYGNLRFQNAYTVAHRASYILYKGPIPTGMLVLHRCDVPECVRPDHLFLGDQKANMDDMAAKGRRKSPHFHGESNHFSKIKEADVSAIRSENMTPKQAKERFGICKSQTNRIKRGASWK